ncbi:reverse transcriptase domain-containing protein [Tanacetum coccineum]
MLKNVQKLNRKLASLNRFFAKSAEKSLPFFKTLKKCTKKSDFHWTAEAEEAFKQMKQLIAELPMLTAPMEKEELIVYLAATKETVSAVLMTKREAKQMPIYFVSISFSACQPRVSVKWQILTDFIVERPEEDSPDTLVEVEEELPEPWILFTDGSSCTDGSGAGLILTNLEGMEFTYALRFRFDATNNEAEYEALIAGLRIAEQMGVKNLQANVDSRLVANQVNVTYDVKEADMIYYLEKIRTLTNSFKAFSIRQVPISTRFIVAKALRTGYYWPTMHKDARTLIRACQDCQVHKPIPRNPQQKLTPITSLWSFYKWGIDIAGPFPEGP